MTITCVRVGLVVEVIQLESVIKNHHDGIGRVNQSIYKDQPDGVDGGGLLQETQYSRS